MRKSHSGKVRVEKWPIFSVCAAANCVEEIYNQNICFKHYLIKWTAVLVLSIGAIAAILNLSGCCYKCDTVYNCSDSKCSAVPKNKSVPSQAYPHDDEMGALEGSILTPLAVRNQTKHKEK